MQETEVEDVDEETRVKTFESDNAWQMKTVSEEDFQRWKTEKERYDEVIEYIREVDEILNLIKPFPRDEPKAVEQTRQDVVRSDSQGTKFGLEYLETIIKLVEQLKELQENNAKFHERTCYLRDLKKLREHKRRLKSEEFELKSKSRGRVCSDNTQEEFVDLSTAIIKNRRSKSASSENEQRPKQGWQDKRKSLCLPQGLHIHENKSKVSKWTKVKEAFHWERATHSVVAKPKKELFLLQLPGDIAKRGAETSSVESDCGRDNSPDGSSMSGLDGFLPPPPPPPPLPPRGHCSLPPRPEGLLSLQPPQDIPSSSSSDKLDEFASFSDLTNKGSKSPDPESPSQLFAPDDNFEIDHSGRKSISEDIFSQIPHHLCKDEFAASRLTKSNKTTWGKVKDIIQTRKDSLKKKPKKRGSEEYKKRREPPSPSGSLVSDLFEDLPTPEEKVKNVVESFSAKITSESEDSCLASQPSPEEKCSKKLMPVLTITLPSTEELRSFSSDELERKDLEEDKTIPNLSSQILSCDDKTKSGKIKSSQNQGLSKWVKVKRVFLTSTGPTRPIQYVPATSSSPTCHSKTSGFFSDFESDEVSSGEWIDDRTTSQEKLRLGDSETQSTALTLIQEDIRKSYNELQKKLSQEFDQKLREWEIKNESLPKPEDSPSKPKKDDGDIIPKFQKTRDSITVPLPSMNDLSPEFKKKLNDWKKIKTSQSTSAVLSKDESQNIKIKIGEWQPWKARGTQKHSLSPENKISCSRPTSSYRKEDEGIALGSSSGRRDSKRRESVKKICHSRTPSGTESISGGSVEKDGRFNRRTQKVKDLQWVEKELQKIEREKMRLEQEREKYLEREARLEQMKRTIGTTLPTQEILVRTPAGFFRFKGISQKFTKKLYEWEKARGIAPEASTFALLEESVKTVTNGSSEFDSSLGLQRSKSMGSVPELSSSLIIQSMAHHPSSLSLNDVDELKSLDDPDALEDSMSSEHLKDGLNETNEPEAVIVDIEDVEEETAIIADTPMFKSEIPVYTYTEDINGLMDSSERFPFAMDSRFDIQIIEKNQNKKLEGGLEIYENHPEIFERDTIRRFESTKKKTDIMSLERIKGDSKILLMAEDNSLNEKDLNKTSSRHVDHHESSTLVLSSGLKTLSAERNEDVIHTHKEESTKIFERRNVEMSSSHSLNKSAKVKNFHNWSSESEKIQLQSSNFASYSHSSEERHFVSRKTELNSSPHLGISFDKHLIQASQAKADPEVLKKKIKEKISLMQRISTEPKINTRNLMESEQTKSTKLNTIATSGCDRNLKDERPGSNLCESSGPVNVFVPTTRKIISPVQTNSGASPAVFSYVIDDVASEDSQDLQPEDGKSSRRSSDCSRRSSKSLSPHRKDDKGLPPSFPKLSSSEKTKPESNIKPEKRVTGIPPLPNSPKSLKKISPKETAPSIRMIIAKYNKKISEHEAAGEKTLETGSSWRSPVLGRRAIRKEDGSWKNNEVQKSASFDNMRSETSTNYQEPQIKGILKSSSVGVMKYCPQISEPTASSSFLPEAKPPSSEASKENSTSPLVLRAMRIQKAKEEFLSGKLEPTKVSVPESKPQEEVRIPQNQSEENLTKSTSTETISKETLPSQSDETQEKLSTERPIQKSSSKFDISSIKSKFRKIRMRKEKENKPNAVAVLCRQSLLIEVPGVWDKNENNPSVSKSCPSSPVMNRTKDDTQKKKDDSSTSKHSGGKK